jgi:hypothetical protein
MQALKTIVIGLGVVLVLGFGLLIYGLTQNWHRLASPARPAAGQSAGWGEVALRQPPQAHLRAMQAVGNHLALHLVDAEGAEGDGARERVVVVDPASGAVVGTFWLAEGP